MIEALRLWETNRSSCLDSMFDNPNPITSSTTRSLTLHDWLRYCMWASEEHGARPDGT